MEYKTLDGKMEKKWFTGLRATIVQHEVDHLDGVLFTARALEQGADIYEEKGGKLKTIEL